ncbi:MAG: carbohydrate kinase, partial [Blautia sp.]|nr:carbohydrate kinase [Blautia sp.]
MSNAKNYLLGMDLGTTNIKGIIADEEGNVEATASSSNEVLHPAPGMVEQNANDWWKNVASVFWSLTRQVPEDIIKNIKGICISSQTVTMLPVDKNGKPLRNALIWMDGRSGKEVSEIISAVGLPEFIRITGGQPDRAFLPNKILWFKKNEPELFEKTCCFLQASSFANYKLTGNMTMDIDQAIKSQCLDINTMEWSKTIGDAIGVDLNKLLPKPQKVHDVIGYVTEAAAEETGLV